METEMIDQFTTVHEKAVFVLDDAYGPNGRNANVPMVVTFDGSNQTVD